MTIGNHTWAIVLAGGEGSRLHGLTTDASGLNVPKQFCSLTGGQSMLAETVRRAATVVEPDQICVVVAVQHRRWWEPMLSELPKSNIIVQPCNRGTGNGVLLPLIHIIARDPSARVVLLPSDHHVRDEPALASTLRLAVGALEDHPDDVLLLGMHPDNADPDLGYIVPGRRVGPTVFRVDRFVEKPSGAAARQLVDRGALWNALIIATRARALLGLFMTRHPDVAAKMQSAVAEDLRSSPTALATTMAYRDLPKIDFSSQILQGCEIRLRLIETNRCGWTDLGTPKRLGETLRELPHVDQASPDSINSASAPMNLSVQHARFRTAIQCASASAGAKDCVARSAPDFSQRDRNRTSEEVDTCRPTGNM
jgi:mannose-1-phosphate guanylyltransferase